MNIFVRYFMWSMVLTWIVTSLVFADEVDLAPGNNPVVDGIDVCRFAAAVGQDFLTATDEANDLMLSGPASNEEEQRSRLTRMRELYVSIERYTGELEIASSICLGLRINPNRLNDEQREELKKVRQNPKVPA